MRQGPHLFAGAIADPVHSGGIRLSVKLVEHHVAIGARRDRPILGVDVTGFDCGWWGGATLLAILDAALVEGGCLILGRVCQVWIKTNAFAETYNGAQRGGINTVLAGKVWGNVRGANRSGDS